MDSSHGSSPPSPPPPQPCPLNCTSLRHNPAHPADVYHLVQGMLILPTPPPTATSSPTHPPQRSAVVMVGGDGEARTQEFQATGNVPPLALDDALRLVLTNIMESDRVVFHVDNKNQIPMEFYDNKKWEVFGRVANYNQKFDEVMDTTSQLTQKAYSLAEPFAFGGGDDPTPEGYCGLPSISFGIMKRKRSAAAAVEEGFIRRAITMVGITPFRGTYVNDRPPLGQILNAFAESLHRPESVAFREEEEGMKDKISELLEAYSQIGKLNIAVVLADRLKTMRGNEAD